jgi:hypothetical protein
MVKYEMINALSILFDQTEKPEIIMLLTSLVWLGSQGRSHAVCSHILQNILLSIRVF